MLLECQLPFQVHILSDEDSAAFCDNWLQQTSPYEFLLLLTDTLYTMYGSSCNSSQGCTRSNTSHTALKSINKLSGKSCSFKQPHFLSFFSNVQEDFIKEFTAPSEHHSIQAYILADVYEHGLNSGMQCSLRAGDIYALMEEIQGNRQISQSDDINCIVGSLELRKNLFQYYSCNQRKIQLEDTGVCQSGLTETTLLSNGLSSFGSTGLKESEVVIQGHIQNGRSVAFINQPSRPFQEPNLKHHGDINFRNGNLRNVFVHKMDYEGKKNPIGLNGDSFLHFEENQPNEEMPFVPYGLGFIPPSEDGSIDDISLCQTMLELNKRNSTMVS